MKRLAVILVLAVAGLAVLPDAGAQIKLVPKARLDSLANPVLAPDSEYLSFDRTEIDLGELSGSDGIVWFSFAVRNLSDRSLTFGQITTSCSCLKATFDRNVLKGGQTATLRASFDPKGHFGPHCYRVEIFTDGHKNPSAVLKVKTKVNE